MRRSAGGGDEQNHRRMRYLGVVRVRIDPKFARLIRLPQKASPAAAEPTDAIEPQPEHAGPLAERLPAPKINSLSDWIAVLRDQAARSARSTLHQSKQDRRPDDRKALWSLAWSAAMQGIDVSQLSRRQLTTILKLHEKNPFAVTRDAARWVPRLPVAADAGILNAEQIASLDAHGEPVRFPAEFFEEFDALVDQPERAHEMIFDLANQLADEIDSFDKTQISFGDWFLADREFCAKLASLAAIAHGRMKKPAREDHRPGLELAARSALSAIFASARDMSTAVGAIKTLIHFGENGAQSNYALPATAIVALASSEDAISVVIDYVKQHSNPWQRKFIVDHLGRCFETEHETPALAAAFKIALAVTRIDQPHAERVELSDGILASTLFGLADRELEVVAGGGTFKGRLRQLRLSEHPPSFTLSSGASIRVDRLEQIKDGEVEVFGTAMPAASVIQRRPENDAAAKMAGFEERMLAMLRASFIGPRLIEHLKETYVVDQLVLEAMEFNVRSRAPFEIQLFAKHSGRSYPLRLNDLFTRATLDAAKQALWASFSPSELKELALALIEVSFGRLDPDSQQTICAQLLAARELIATDRAQFTVTPEGRMRVTP